MLDRNAYMRDYYAKNKDRWRANAKARRLRKLGAEREYDRQRYAREKERIRSRQKVYRESARGLLAHNNSNATRRAKTKGAFVEKVDRNILYEMYGGMCGICKQFIDGEFHVDHIRPLALGGQHGYVNCQPAHASCNLKKKRK